VHKALRIPKGKDVLELARECEASARRILKSLGNPPEEELTIAIMPRARDCFLVLGFVKDLRKAVGAGQARAAGLAAFRLGQAVLSLAIRPLAADADRGVRMALASRAGAAASKLALAVSEKTIEQLASRFLEMRAGNPKISINRASQLLSSESSVRPRTIRKYLSRKFPQV